ncbi:MAG TPA: heme o synthase [Candidatus Saccharimonadales bacterium]
MSKDKLSAYYRLTKPGVTYGNVLTAVAGFFLASAGSIDIVKGAMMTVGMTLVIGSACALNNYLDRDIDKIMERTKKRPSVTGEISTMGMRIFPWILLAIGVGMLAFWTNWLTVAIAIAGFVTYVWLYGAWTKRTSVHGTAVGAVSGALPIAAGYASVNGVADIGLAIAFLIIFFWQFPEFYSISIYRRKEYAEAGVPLMSVVRGVRPTIQLIAIYTVFYVASTLALAAWGYAGIVYFVVMALAGGYWIWLATQGLHAKHPETWSRRMFRFSMYTILLLCLMLSVGPVLP